MYEKLVKIEDIQEEMVLISESNTDYVTPSGRVYKDYGNGLFYPKIPNINAHNGYVYIGITCKDGKNRGRRLHRILAITFIENPKPEEYDVVGHKDNDKTNYNLENLYWTNTKENTKKAFDDQLLKNDIGISDSQSIPIAVYKNDGTFVSVYGSISQASRCIDGYSKTNISHMLDKSKKGRKGYYFRSISKNEYLRFTGVKNLKFSIYNVA